MNRRRSSMRIAAAVFAAALIGAACSPAEEAAESTVTSTTPTTSTTIVATTTTESVPVTVPPATSTTVPPTTTTEAPATTTTSPPVVLTVELTDEGIQVGPTWLPFGSDDDDTVAALIAALGPPSDDSGWLDSLTDGWDRFGVCPSPNVRGVSWGVGNTSLQLLFTDADTDFWVGGVEHFFTFYYNDSSEPTGLTTPEGIGVGSSLGQLKTAYDPAKIEIEEAFFDPAVGFWAYDYNPWTGLWGYATGQSDAHVITSINGGRGCGE